MKILENKIMPIADQIFSLVKEMENTTDPTQRAAIKKQIENLNRQRVALLAELNKILEAATAAGCQ